MTSAQTAGRRRVALIGVIVASAVSVLGAYAIAAEPSGSKAGAGESVACRGADQVTLETSLRKARKAMRCLINEERAIHAGDAVLNDPRLQRAAQDHTRQMVREGCLAHRCGDEPDLETRVRRSGYLEGASRWRFAENTGCGLSAEAMVANWMASRFHRINILEREFTEVGVGVVHRPARGKCKRGYSTFTAVLAFRED